MRAALAQRFVDGRDLFSEVDGIVDDVSVCLRELVTDDEDGVNEWAHRLVTDTESSIWAEDSGSFGPIDSTSRTASIGPGTRSDAALVKEIVQMDASDDFAIEFGQPDKASGLRYLTALFARGNDSYKWPMYHADFARYMEIEFPDS